MNNFAFFFDKVRPNFHLRSYRLSKTNGCEQTLCLAAQHFAQRRLQLLHSSKNRFRISAQFKFFLSPSVGFWTSRKPETPGRFNSS